jgi:hypothetical protein
MSFVINQSRAPFSITAQPRQDRRTSDKGKLT